VRKLNLTLLGLIVVVLVTAMVVMPGNARRLRGAKSTINIVKTFDLYYTKCTGNCIEGECLVAASNSLTRLTFCALQFSQPDTTYAAYVLDGSYQFVGGNNVVHTYQLVADELGRVIYDIKIMTSNPGKAQSLLTGAVLCFAALFDGQVGSNYDQFENADGVFDWHLPDNDSPDFGQNVYLCPGPISP
jgi:hypothetical protein